MHCYLCEFRASETLKARETTDVPISQSGGGTIGLIAARYRSGDMRLWSAIWQHVSWMLFFTVFFSGLSWHCFTALCAVSPRKSIPCFCEQQLTSRFTAHYRLQHDMELDRQVLYYIDRFPRNSTYRSQVSDHLRGHVHFPSWSDSSHDACTSHPMADNGY